MSVDYRITVKCEDCYAVTTYTNERPEWQTWEPDPKEIRKAKRWLALPEEKRGTAPAYIVPGGFLAPPYLSYVDSHRYITCPACDGEALPIDAAAVEQEQGRADVGRGTTEG